MKIFVVLVAFCWTSVSANCGCLKCSTHLEGVNVPGPCGPVKFIYEKPQTQHTSYTPVIEEPLVATPAKLRRNHCYKVRQLRKQHPQPLYSTAPPQNQQCSATLQAPLATTTPLPPTPIENLQYKADTILVPEHAALPAEVATWLQNFQQQINQLTAARADLNAPCSCCNRLGFTTCSSACDSKVQPATTREKRDIARDGYNWLIKMVPQHLREPIHHSIRGLSTEPERSLRQKIEKWIKEIKAPVEPQLKPTHHPLKKHGLLSFPKEVVAKKPIMPSYNPSPHTLFGIPKVAPRHEQSSPKADESNLLKKLKKLNSNPFSSDLEEQATSFVKGLLQPEKPKGLQRKKRTIIVGSDELDLPAHYKVDLVSDEDDLELSNEEEKPLPLVSKEEPYDLKYFSEEEGPSPLVGRQRFFAPPIPPRQLFSSLNRLQPRPDVIMSKNVIQKAVKQELEAFHKKQENEQKLKDMKANLKAKHAPVVPQNPIFLLLTAPMQFLKHFSDLNKGANPMIMTLPKMVYSAKKCFKDFGKNFHKHCLNLASDIAGDFDDVHPNVIQRISLINGDRRPRDVSNQFFREARPSLGPDIENVEGYHVRKKRYVIKVVDDADIQDEVEDYLTEKMDDQFSYLKPLQEYYNKVSDLFAKLQTVQPAHLADEEVEEKPRKKLVVQKIKPRLIIDNKGWPFMEYDGFKRPLLLNRRKHHGMVKKAQSPKSSEEAEEGEEKIAAIIARAKDAPEIVGSAPKDIMPRQIIKERIHSLLEEIDQLVDLNAEEYDKIFENLLKVQQIKTSIEQDWKRLLMNNQIDDINAKVGLLSKFKDLQKIKNEGTKNIVAKLQENNNEFVRKQLIRSLIRLQKLQCLITKFVEDFDHNLQMKTSFSTKKEIKYIDYLSELKFVYASTRTRNDLVKKLCQDRDVEGQKNIELLNKLKKLLAMSDRDSQKFETATKLIWELKNLKKMQGDAIKEMNERLEKRQNIKKEMKILFDLQKRFEDCSTELSELLGIASVKHANKIPEKKDVKQVVAEIRRRHEEMLQKAKTGGWHNRIG